MQACRLGIACPVDGSHAGAAIEFAIPETLQGDVFGNPVSAWLAAAVAMVAVWLILPAAKGFAVRRLSRSAEAEGPDSWQSAVLQITQRTGFLFLLVVGVYAGTTLLTLPTVVETSLGWAFVIVAFTQAALWLDRLVSVITEWRVRQTDAAAASARNAISLIRFVGRVAVWSVAILLMLSNLGIDVTALVAGLGIGGIAVALAAQNILGDLFASLAIILDKPFEVGDFIIVGDKMGAVERIGIKTTRIRSLTGEQLVMANADLLGSRVHNYKRMNERRVVFSIGVTYETPADKVEILPGLLREIVEAQEPVRFDRAHFKSYGDFALVFEIVYWVLSADYNVYMDIQQTINLEILKRFEALGVGFAYPTQTVHLHGAAAGGAS